MNRRESGGKRRKRIGLEREGGKGIKKESQRALRRKFERVDLGSCLVMADRFLIMVEGEGGKWEVVKWRGIKMEN